MSKPAATPRGRDYWLDTIIEAARSEQVEGKSVSSLLFDFEDELRLIILEEIRRAITT